MPNFTLPDAVFEQAAAKFPTPFYLYDEAGIRSTARAMNKAFAWAPDFKEYFAVKALPNPRILEILKEESCGLDCSSECELLLAQRIGMTGEDIMFSANAMPPSEFDMARAMGAIINLDDITDIDTLAAHGGIPEVVCIRYNPGGSFTVDNSAIMGDPGDSKYGWTTAQLPEGLKKLKLLGAKKFGIHAFLASNCTDNNYYPTLAGILFDVGKKLAEVCDMPLAFINLSGGVGIPYSPDEKAADIAVIGAGVQKEYRRVFGDKREVGIKTELGRFMTGPHGYLVTRAMHEKRIYKHYIGVDACASNLIRPAMYGAYHHIHVTGKRDVPATATYDITGSLCENNDKFAIDRTMPPIKMGDLLVIHDAGAHSFAMGYQYNGRLRSAEVLYKGGSEYQLIRRAETPDDYFSTLL